MSDCGVCIGVDDGFDSPIYDVKERRARKAHRCYECGATIQPGDRYEYASGLCEGSWWDSHTCMACADIATALSCGYRTHGSLWEDLREIRGDLGLGCLEKLSTAAGKEKLMAYMAEARGVA